MVYKPGNRAESYPPAIHVNISSALRMDTNGIIPTQIIRIRKMICPKRKMVKSELESLDYREA